MNVIKKNINLLFLYILAVSCISDDGLFEKDVAVLDIQKSITIVTVLHELRITEMTKEEDLCFSFDYPLTLGYNTGASITVSDFKGFKETVYSQTPSFNVSKINFPFSLQLKTTDSSIIINNEQQFNTLISDCNFSTLREEINTTLDFCFDYKYPIKLTDINNTPRNITDRDSLRVFLITQGEDYQPKHQFPIDLIILETNEIKRINSYFDLHNILTDCKTTIKNCPQTTIEVIKNLDIENKFAFKTTSISNATYEWYLNGTLLPKETFSFYGTVDLPPGDYEICTITNFNLERCDETSSSSCTNITSPEVCPEILFEPAVSPLGNIVLARLIEQSGYDKVFTWFIDGQEVSRPTDTNLPTNGFNLSNLEDGTHEVCVRSKSIFCNTESVYCEEIVIDFCPEITFSVEETATEGGYIFKASFPRKNSISYSWVVDGTPIELDGGVASFSDNKLEFTFQVPGTHTICIETLGSAPCLNSISECQKIIFR